MSGSVLLWLHSSYRYKASGILHSPRGMLPNKRHLYRIARVNTIRCLTVLPNASIYSMCSGPPLPYFNNDGFNPRQRIQDIQTAVAETTALHAEDYFEHLYSSLTKNSNDYQLRLSIISDAMKLLEGHSLQARTLEAELMEENRVGKLLSQAQELTQTLRDMTGAAEELWCFIVDDPDATKLIQQYSRRELRFQRPNVDK